MFSCRFLSAESEYISDFSVSHKLLKILSSFTLTKNCFIHTLYTYDEESRLTIGNVNVGSMSGREGEVIV